MSIMSTDIFHGKNALPLDMADGTQNGGPRASPRQVGEEIAPGPAPVIKPFTTEEQLRCACGAAYTSRLDLVRHWDSKMKPWHQTATRMWGSDEVLELQLALDREYYG